MPLSNVRPDKNKASLLDNVLKANGTPKYNSIGLGLLLQFALSIILGWQDNALF